MKNSSSLEASDGVLKSDCNDIIPDLNATLLDASEVSPPQKRRKGKPNMKSFALFPTYSDKYMHKVWESKTKTPRDIVLFQRLQETVLFKYFKKPACKFDRTYCKEIFLKHELLLLNYN